MGNWHFLPAAACTVAHLLCTTMMALLMPAAMRAGGETPQPQEVSTPRLGLLVEGPELKVRGILGIPGAARFGPAMDFASPVKRVMIAPEHDYILLLSDSVLAVLPSELAVKPVAGSAGESPTGTAIAGSPACVDVWSFSPGGEAFASYCRDRGTVQIVSGLPKQPRVEPEIPVANLGAHLVRLALSDDGSKIVTIGETGEAFVLASSGSHFRFMLKAGLSAIGFLPRKSDFIISDTELGEVWRYSVIYEAPQGRRLWRPDEGIGMITQVWVGEGQAVAYFYSGKSGRAWKMHLDTSEVVELELPGGSDMFLPLAKRDQFLVSARPGAPAWVCDAAGESMQCRLIPAVPGSGRVGE